MEGKRQPGTAGRDSGDGRDSPRFPGAAGCAFVSEVWEGDGGQEKREERRAGRLLVGDFQLVAHLAQRLGFEGRRASLPQLMLSGWSATCLY